MSQLQDLFKGRFLLPAAAFTQKLAQCRAFVFDWDGVFNKGDKDADGSSPFNEVDSMGTNLLRFNHYLRKGAVPLSAIISGETNKIALKFARRESFQSVYCGFRDKAEALRHLCDEHGIRPEEIAFFFDDVLDLALAQKAGLRIMIGRACNPVFTDYAVRSGCADYITACSGGEGAIRECTELLIAASGIADDTFDHRIRFSEEYTTYLSQRKGAQTQLYTLRNSIITATEDL